MGFKSVLFTFVSILCFSALAIEESRLGEKFMSDLVPSMLGTYKHGSFIGVDQIKINYYFLEKSNPDGVLILSPGQSESSLKYAEILYDLKDLNYSVFIIDHRGQGESGRLIPDLMKSHVNHFSDYVEDFSHFVLSEVKPQNYRRSFLISHSMGGAIASGFMARYPKQVTAAVFFSPMLEINTGRVNNLVADIISSTLNVVGFSTTYAPGQKPYNGSPKFEENSVTSSRARYKIRTDLYNKYTQLQLGGTTVNWLKQSLEFTLGLRTTPNLYQVPTIIFQAGHDQLVELEAQNQTCELRSPEMCRVVKIGFENSQHEILMEVDLIRNRALAALRAYIHYFEK